MNRAIKIFTNTNQIPIRKQKPNQNEQSIGSPRQPPQYGAPAKMSGGAPRRRVAARATTAPRARATSKDIKTNMLKY